MPGAPIFRTVLADVVKREDGTRPYWRSTPFGKGFPNDERTGNHHQWRVWSEWIDYPEYERDMARFVSEFGFQAPATLPTWREALQPSQRSLSHPAVEHHNKQVEGQERLMRFVTAHYPVPNTFEEWVRRCQLVPSPKAIPSTNPPPAASAASRSRVLRPVLSVSISSGEYSVPRAA